MPTIPASVADLMRKDPLRGFVGIPIAAANAPGVRESKKYRVITFRTSSGQVVNKILVPEWTGDEWAWWGGIAMRCFQKATPRNDAGAKDMQAQAERFAPILEGMRGVPRPHDQAVAQFYDRAVRLMLAVQAAHTGESWRSIAGAAFADAFVEAPATVAAAIAWVVQGGTEAAAAIATAAARILAELFKGALRGVFQGLGGWGIALIAALAWYATRGNRD